MNRITRISALTVGLVVSATAAQASCIVEYKAKRDNPLELYYDVAQVGGDCTVAEVSERLQKELAKQGLTLLKVLSVRKK